jgi:hypothetical protein
MPLINGTLSRGQNLHGRIAEPVENLSCRNPGFGRMIVCQWQGSKAAAPDVPVNTRCAGVGDLVACSVVAGSLGAGGCPCTEE